MTSSNPMKDLVAGLIGGAAGVLAMDLFRQHVSPLITGDGVQQPGDPAADSNSIALIGQHHRPDESSTDALGRMLYHTVEGADPTKQTKSELSNLVHWSYGVFQGGLYGAVRPAMDGGDMVGGALFGTGLWLVGDELAVPLLGLQDGPAASPPSTHLNRWAMHLAYGITTAVATQYLKKML